MPFELPLPKKLKAESWKVKIREKERVEPPHGHDQAPLGPRVFEGYGGERAALALFVSNLTEQVHAGKVQDAEAAAVCRMLDQAGYAHLKVSATGRVPNLHGYPRAVTS